MKKILFYLPFLAYFTSVAQIETIPFEEHGLMYIKVKVNNYNAPLDFIFDTGASTAVLNTRVAEKLNISSDYQQSARGVNGTKVYDIATGQKVSLNDIKITDVNLVLVDLIKLEEKTGRNIDGIIGFDILRRYITEFDFGKMEINLYSFKDRIEKINTFKKLPFRFNGPPIPVVDLTFKMVDNTNVSGSFLFDSGASLTALFNTPFAKRKNLKNKIGKSITLISRGLNESSSNTYGSALELEIGNFVFENFPIELAQSSKGVSGSRNFDGILGAEIIHRFDMVLNYKTKTIYLKPNSKFTKAFKFPMCGMSLSLVNNKIVVDEIIEDSPDYESGIRIGDELISINGYKGNDLKKWKSILKEEDQKEIQIQLKRKSSNTIKQVSFKLRKMI